MWAAASLCAAATCPTGNRPCARVHLQVEREINIHANVSHRHIIDLVRHGREAVEGGWGSGPWDADVGLVAHA